MRSLFTEKETLAIWFLGAALILGLVTGEVRKYLAESKAAENLPLVMERIREFKEVSARIDSSMGLHSITFDSAGNILAMDVNRANAAELALLPGIGKTLAERIIDRRQKVGSFLKADDLLTVRGIGPKKLERIRPLVEEVLNSLPAD